MWFQRCTNYLCILGTSPEVEKDDEVDFLGMSLDSSAATAGQWILLAIGLVLLVATIALAYKYSKAKKRGKSASTMELK